MTETYRIIEVGNADWDEALARFDERTVFHGSAWVELLEQRFGLKSYLLKAEGSSSGLALWPCLVQRKGPFLITGSPLPGWSTPYLGPLFAEGTDVTAALEAFLAHPALARSAFVACRTREHAVDIDLTQFGFERRADFDTYVVELDRDEDELWSSLKSECRSRIRKAQRAGVHIEQETGPEFLDDFWRMAQEVFAKSGKKPTFDQALLNGLWEALHPVGLLTVLSAFHAGTRVATLMLPHDDRRMYYWAGGSFREHLDVAPNNLLHWEAILTARRLGLEVYDFIATEGGAGRFKRTFRPTELRVATKWERSRSTLAAKSKAFYERAARRRGRLGALRKRGATVAQLPDVLRRALQWPG